MRYNKIKMNDVANGDGIGISLYTQGCPHHCKNCFNQETWNYTGGKEFTQKEEKQILEGLKADEVQRHLSILGGEPLCEQNKKGVLELCAKVKKTLPQTKIYIWTGYQIEDLQLSKNDLCNIDYIIDGKFIEEKKDISLKWRGSSNQRIIDIKNTIKFKKIVIFIP